MKTAVSGCTTAAGSSVCEKDAARDGDDTGWN